MRFLALFAIAWAANWLTTPSTSDDTVDFGTGLVLSLIFALFAWLYARRGDGNQRWIAAAGWMLIGITLMKYGGAYQTAQGAGLSTGDSMRSAIFGWTGIFGLIGVGTIVYAKWRMKARHER